MHVLTIYSKTKYDTLIKNIYDIKELLENKGIYIEIDCGTDNEINYLKILCEDSYDNNDNISLLIIYVAQEIYNILIKNFCSQELENYIYDKYFFLNDDEIYEITKKVYDILFDREKIDDGDILYCINRKNIIKKTIVEFLEENSVINIEGFATFRIKDVIKNVYLICDKVVEEYMAEKEYTEFVKLLRYFIEIQESKINVVNIIFKKNGEYLVVDDKKNNLIKEFTRTMDKDNNINTDDVIMSGLVTNSPKKIIIHKSQNAVNKEFINTLKNVFEDRVLFCDSCELCAESKKNDTLLLTKMSNSNKIK